jgi:drug/metabolite transporter (DMT)-like permease
MTLFSFSVPRLGASGFAILANTELVTVVLIGVLVLGEAFTAARAIGGALIVAGILTHALSRGGALVALPARTLPRLRRRPLPPPLAGEG